MKDSNINSVNIDVVVSHRNNLQETGLLSRKGIFLSSSLALLTLVGCQTMPSTTNTSHDTYTEMSEIATPNESHTINSSESIYGYDESQLKKDISTASASQKAPAIIIERQENIIVGDAPTVSDSQQPSTQPSTPQNEQLTTPKSTRPDLAAAPDAKTTQQILLDRARQNSHISSKAPNSGVENGDNIPAFRRLMDTGINQLKNNQLSEAENTFTRAQRLAPQSSAVYFYLGQVALKQNNPIKCEAMARRGLVVAQSQSRKKALWQLILKSAQMQGNARVMTEANAALARL